MDLIFDLLIPDFFVRDELLVSHSELCRLVSGKYRKIYDSSPVMTFFKKYSSFSIRSRRSRHTFLRFSFYSSVRVLEPALHKFSACPIPLSKCRGLFSDSNWTQYGSFWLSNVDQTSWQPSLRSHFRPFWRVRSYRTRFVFHTLTPSQKYFVPPKNLCFRYSMLSISPF